MTSLKPELRVFQSKRLKRFKAVILYKFDRDEEPGLIGGFNFLAIPSECEFDRPIPHETGILGFSFSDMREFRAKNHRYYSIVLRGTLDPDGLAGITLSFWHPKLNIVFGACDADAKDLD